MNAVNEKGGTYHPVGVFDRWTRAEKHIGADAIPAVYDDAWNRKNERQEG